MKWSLLALVLSALAVRVFADDEAPDKSAYTLFNPTPDADLQLDFGGNFSLNGVPPRTQLYTGLSQRF